MRSFGWLGGLISYFIPVPLNFNAVLFCSFCIPSFSFRGRSLVTVCHINVAFALDEDRQKLKTCRLWNEVLHFPSLYAAWSKLEVTTTLKSKVELDWKCGSPFDCSFKWIFWLILWLYFLRFSQKLIIWHGLQIILVYCMIVYLCTVGSLVSWFANYCKFT